MSQLITDLKITLNEDEKAIESYDQKMLIKVLSDANNPDKKEDIDRTTLTATAQMNLMENYVKIYEHYTKNALISEVIEEKVVKIIEQVKPVVKKYIEETLKPLVEIDVNGFQNSPDVSNHMNAIKNTSSIVMKLKNTKFVEESTTELLKDGEAYIVVAEKVKAKLLGEEQFHRLFSLASCFVCRSSLINGIRNLSTTNDHTVKSYTSYGEVLIDHLDMRTYLELIRYPELQFLLLPYDDGDKTNVFNTLFDFATLDKLSDEEHKTYVKEQLKHYFKSNAGQKSIIQRVTDFMTFLSVNYDEEDWSETLNAIRNNSSLTESQKIKQVLKLRSPSYWKAVSEMAYTNVSTVNKVTMIPSNSPLLCKDYEIFESVIMCLNLLFNKLSEKKSLYSIPKTILNYNKTIFSDELWDYKLIKLDGLEKVAKPLDNETLIKEVTIISSAEWKKTEQWDVLQHLVNFDAFSSWITFEGFGDLQPQIEFLREVFTNFMVDRSKSSRLQSPSNNLKLFTSFVYLCDNNVYINNEDALRNTIPYLITNYVVRAQRYSFIFPFYQNPKCPFVNSNADSIMDRLRE